MIKTFKHNKTGVIINEIPGLSHTTANNVPIPYWYMELNPINTDWTQVPSWEITAVMQICVCGHNGQSYDKKTSTIYEITRYPDNVVFKIGDHVTNGTKMNGKIVSFDVLNGLPFATTDWSGIGMDIFSLKHIDVNIDERIYWSVIDSIGWGRTSTDHRQISANLEYMYAPEFIDKLKGFVVKKRRDLQNRLKEYVAITPNTKCNVWGISDDQFYDVTAHIVGLGEQTYSDLYNHPELIPTYNYKENFEYIFH